MVEPAPLPSLFGRFTAIFQDHDELGKTLAQLRKMCAQLEPSSTLSEGLSPPQLLAQLQEDLMAHFAAEESAGYFGIVVAEAPELAPQVTALKWEHLVMLNTVRQLTKIARQRRRWLELVTPTLELVAQLETHERAESGLLGRLFRSAASGER